MTITRSKQITLCAERLPEPERTQFLELMDRWMAVRLECNTALQDAWHLYHSVVPPRAIQLVKGKAPTPITPDVETFIAHLKSYVSRTGNNCFSFKFVEAHRTDILPGLSRNEARRLIKAARDCGVLIEMKTKERHPLWRLA